MRIIDFDRYDFGDPREEFNRIVWCATASPYFATGWRTASFLGKYGKVFKVFDDQDSGNLCFGVQNGGSRLATLDKELRFYLARSRSTYARMPEMQKPVSDLVVDGTKTPEEIADEILTRIDTRNHYDAPIDGSHIKIATESDFHYILDIGPFRRTESIRHAIKRDECYIAVYDGVIKDFAIMNYTFFDNGFIELLMVAEKYRQHGIGLALLNHLFAVCKPEKLFTSTNQSNKPMRKLLGKSGFTFCGQIDALDEGDPELFFVKNKAV
ncbi:MAG TPA: GNAT family N-acetyltransferase [Methylomusa anaerophila]|uniref:Acetyltransferase (GNAT) family protein n=1 Tax=Methylomusa anaerophila TaxID=1930071 RepID=A0A348AH72_9FIRM|nr:GNAT family N-acetyltransferase [Methylomusa anaerophila]BBB90420.1 acetyltransferase (GNAT) family protein [Methylomusa anaerophila]HML90365.1 GNAT family N-acetyltransferase [Methylomusa anaerophila]